MRRIAIITAALMLTVAGFAQAMKSITFGSYPQQSDSKEPIEWLILQEKDGQMLLVSRYCLTSLPWHNHKAAVTWDVSDIRRWLNGEFLETAFSKTEQSAIVRTHLDNRDQLGNGTPVGTDTEDRIFCSVPSMHWRFFMTMNTERSQHLTPSVRESMLIR